MWLLDVDQFRLCEFFGSDIPPYAILSHTWGKEEVNFQDITTRFEYARGKAGFAKIQGCCDQAKRDSLEWVWVDTCAIDKRSSAELSEAINSMFLWYKRAVVCYAYLEDIPGGNCNAESRFEGLGSSRWFTRGWTLQELIAPPKVRFCASDWSYIGMKHHSEGVFMEALAKITGINLGILEHPFRMFQCSIAQRMSWVAKRQTTREEDWAYSLMGMFDVHMPIIYGEGLQKAFKRLQLEILQIGTDQTIFAWKSKERKDGGLLATTPKDFTDCVFTVGTGTSISYARPFSMTNIGMQIGLPLMDKRKQPDFNNLVASATLTAWTIPKPGEQAQRIQVMLKSLERTYGRGNGPKLYQRVRCDMLTYIPANVRVDAPEDIYVVDDVQADHLEASGAIQPSFTLRAGMSWS